MAVKTRTQSPPQRRITGVNSPASGLEQSPEREVLRAALGFQEITVDIPPGANLEQVERTLGIAVEGYNRLQNGIERIKPIIGRILLTVEERKLFRPTYKNMTEFLSKVVEERMGLSHTTATDALRIAKKFSSLDTAEYQNIGATRLLYATQVMSDKDEGYKQFLEESTRMTTAEFKAVVDAKKKGAKPPATTEVLTMRVLPDAKREWIELQTATEMTASDLLTACMYAFKNAQASKPKRTH